ncbi:MAG: YihY/virulence factor BrkB family protein, partial [Promicromonosporaceae bacterium]|nr:YihY/virulence factor BrkB family protein [Promicromonosporaceae bacterium]
MQSSGLMEQGRDRIVDPALRWWNASRPARSLSWFARRGGNQFAGGIAYSALFSLFGGLTIGWTVFSRVLGANPTLEQNLLQQINSWIPGLVGEGDGYLIRPAALVLAPGLSWAAFVA